MALGLGVGPGVGLGTVVLTLTRVRELVLIAYRSLPDGFILSPFAPETVPRMTKVLVRRSTLMILLVGVFQVET